MKEANEAGERRNESEGVDAETDLPEGENEGQGDDEEKIVEQKEEVSQGQFQRSHADQVLRHEVCEEKKGFAFADCKLV